MATRFYFNEAEAAAVSPTISAVWEHQNVVRRRMPRTTPDASTLSTVAYTPDAADHLVIGDAHHRQYVSDQLAAQNIAGTITGQFQCLEAHTSNNLRLTIKIFVVDSAGTTIKETLLAITAATSEVNNTIRNVTFQSQSLAAADIEANDRIVVEIGLGGTPTASGGVQGHNGSIRWGGSAAGGDLAVNETEVGTTFRPWIEFSDDITLPAQQFNQTVAAICIGTPALITRLSVLRSLAAVNVGVAALVTGLVFQEALSAISVGVTTVVTRATFTVSAVATAIGIATLTTLSQLQKTLASVAVGVAGLTAQFISGGGGAVRRLLNLMRVGK